MKSGAEVIERVISFAPLAQPQRTAPYSDFWGGRPCLDFFKYCFIKEIGISKDFVTKKIGIDGQNRRTVL